MALPAQIKAEARGEGYLGVAFVQDGEVMPNSYGQRPADVLLAYPRQGRMMRNPGDPYLEQERADALNEALAPVNELLASWCS